MAMRYETINAILVQHGEQIFSRPYEPVHFVPSLEADVLINNLDDYPHAFVIACIKDRQIKAENAWSIPYEIKKRLGSFDFANLQALSLNDIKSLMTQPTPLHRFPADMAKNLYLAIQPGFHATFISYATRQGNRLLLHGVVTPVETGTKNGGLQRLSHTGSERPLCCGYLCVSSFAHLEENTR